MKSPHYDLICKYYENTSQTAWGNSSGNWWEISEPTWNPEWQWHIGPTPPEQTKMCELGGLQFPMPETVAPDVTTEYWEVGMHGASLLTWSAYSWQLDTLKYGLLHLNEQDAERHSDALRAVNLQAVGNAR